MNSKVMSLKAIIRKFYNKDPKLTGKAKEIYYSISRKEQDSFAAKAKHD